MIITLVIAFGACAYFSRLAGYSHGLFEGIVGTLDELEETKVISISASGIVSPFREAVTDGNITGSI